MEIKIAYDKPISCNVGDLVEFQNDIKILTEAKYKMLANEIVTTGFAFAPHVWVNPTDSKLYLIDGHQRIKVLKRLISNGYNIDSITVIPVMAENYTEAKRRVLQGASQYGEFSEANLKSYIRENNFSLEDINASFSFDNIDLIESIKKDLIEIEKKEESVDVSEGSFSKIIHTCPNCGHQFSRE